jgi:hypothetical protein
MSKNKFKALVLLFLLGVGLSFALHAEEVEIVRDYGSESYQYKALEALLEPTGVTVDQLPRVESKIKPGQFYFTVPASVAPGNTLLNKTVELANKECMAVLPVGITSLADVSSVSEIDMVEYTKAGFKDLVTTLVGNDKPSKYIKEVEQPSIHHYLFASYYGVSIAKVKTDDGASRFVFYSNKTNCLNVATILNLDEVDPALVPK